MPTPYEIHKKGKEKFEKTVTELVERIVIDYANLSGRETTNRAEFRKCVESHLYSYQSHITSCELVQLEAVREWANKQDTTDTIFDLLSFIDSQIKLIKGEK